MAWMETIKRLFSKTGRSDTGMEHVRVILAADNPYGVDLWDCATFTQSMISTSSDPGVAARFAQLRTATGNEHRNQLPSNASVTDCALTYPVAQGLSDGPLFKATEMEDKWDIYFYNPYIYFARSWGGQLMYRATVRCEDQFMIVTQIQFAGDQELEFSRRAVDYLVKTHILGALAPHPLPADLPAAPMQVAAYSFSRFGRRCAFGTYADTTALPWRAGVEQPPSSSAI